MYNATKRTTGSNSKLGSANLPLIASRAPNSSSISGGYRILCIVVGLALATFISSAISLSYYSHSSSALKDSSLNHKDTLNDKSYFGALYSNILDSQSVRTIFQLLPFQNPITTNVPTTLPTYGPSPASPTVNPSDLPSLDPSVPPSQSPSSNIPTISPSTSPSSELPTITPSADPSVHPSFAPTANPTNSPSVGPSADPTYSPTDNPSFGSTLSPTQNPSIEPSTAPPSSGPLPDTSSPSHLPSPAPVGSLSADVSLASLLSAGSTSVPSLSATFSVASDLRMNLTSNPPLIEPMATSPASSTAPSPAATASPSSSESIPLINASSSAQPPLAPVLSVGFIGNSSSSNSSERTYGQPAVRLGGGGGVVLGANGSAPARCRESFPTRCPNDEALYGYVRFWNKRFSLEDCYHSPLRFDPLKQPPQEEKFLLFEPDRGGWNNIRMAAETAMVFAHASGRTLVLPPVEKWYLLDKNKKPAENKVTFRMFFDLEKVREAMPIISMEEFLERVAMKGLLQEKIPSQYTTAASFIGEKTFWEGNNRIYKYLEKACYTRSWRVEESFVGFNLTADGGFGPIRPSRDDPRFKEISLNGKRSMFPYNETMHSHRCIFFPGDYRDEFRLLIHYYAYVYWADKHVSKIYRRIVRDRLHYHDDIFCAAGQLVKAIHEDSANLSLSSVGLSGSSSSALIAKAMEKQVQPTQFYHRLTEGGNTNLNATYFAFHIRRGDFQYKDTQIPAERIWANARPLLDPSISRLIYIATDESDRSFFKPFLESGEFTVRFLSDYTRKFADQDEGQGQGDQGQKKRKPLLSNMNHVGMVEQVICANAHTFFGTPYSTFTGYITRMRGYYRDGRYERTYYTQKHRMFQLQNNRLMHGGFWSREFEVAHKEIDDYYQQMLPQPGPRSQLRR